MTPSLELINLLEWLPEHRETIYLLDDWFIIKHITQEQADGRDCIGQDMGEGLQSLYALSRCVTFSVSPPTRKLSKPCNLQIFMETSLCRHE